MTLFPRIHVAKRTANFRLVKLQPEGLGTPAVESLSSYLTRLAAAHWLTPTNLYMALSNEVFGNQSKRLTRVTRLDGYSKRSREVASVLNTSTAINVNFVGLTLSAWHEGFATHGCGLLRENLAWCDDCLRDDQSCGRDRYNRLCWSIREVVACSTHDHTLRDSCPHCGAKQAPIVANAQVGFCQMCGLDLVAPSGSTLRSDTKPTTEQAWKSKACLGLLSATQSGLTLKRQDFLNRFDDFLADYRGAPKTMAKELNLRVDVIRSWVRRNHNPQFDVFLEFCYRLDVPLVNFFEKTGSLPIHRPRVRRKTPARKEPPLSKEFLLAAQLKLTAVLAGKDDIQKLLDVASSAGLTVRQMQYNFPDECASAVRRIFERRAREKLERDAARVERLRRYALSLVRRGIYPSQRKMMNRPDITSSDLRLASVRAALREIQDKFLRHHPELKSDSKFMLHMQLSRRRMPTAKEISEQERLQSATRRLR